MGFLSFLGPVVDLVRYAATQLGEWDQRRTVLAQARLEAELAATKAQAELATFKAKADIEWDLKWANEASKSWKDEFLLVLWALPLICLFIPPLAPHVMQGFEYLKSFHPDAPHWYMVGWSALFAASLGMKKLVDLMMPSRVSKLATAIAAIPDDIPPQVAEDAEVRVIQALDNYKTRP